LGTHIKEIRLWRGMTQEELAKLAKTTSATISRWENYPSRVSVDVLTNLARILDVHPAELLAGVRSQSQPSGGVVMIRVLESKQSNPFDPAILEAVTRTPAADLAMMNVKGDAMSPTLQNGDQCLVDTSDTDVFSSGLYCIQLGRTAQVRRLSVNPINGKINIRCDNKSYDDYVDVKLDAVKVIGRVIWRGQKI